MYEAVKAIPHGRVTTYKEIRDMVGQGSARSVGRALKKNPFAPSVPCHRVIRSDLSIGGFRGRVTGSAVNRKIEMLEEEGVDFYNGRLSNPGDLWSKCRGGRSHEI